MQEFEAVVKRLERLLDDLDLPKKTNRFSQILKPDVYGAFEEDSLNVFKDFFDLEHILDSAHYFDKELLRAIIEKVIKGNLHARGNEDSKPRDFQAELTAAARFQRENMTVTLGDGNPDFVIFTHYIDYGFEVKRISSHNPYKAKERAKEAAKQLRDGYLNGKVQNRIGVIYLSIENHLQNNMHVWTVADFEVARLKVIHELKLFMDRHNYFATDRDVMKDQRIAGIVVNYCQPYFNVSIKQYGIYNRYEFIANEAYWQSRLYVTPQFEWDIHRPHELASRIARDRILEEDRSILEGKDDLAHFIDASYLLPCSSLLNFKSDIEASEYINRNWSNLISFKCYKCSMWHVRGPDTIYSKNPIY